MVCYEGPLSLIKVLFHIYDSDANINSICIKIMRDMKHGCQAYALVTELDTKEIISDQNNCSV